MNLHVLACVDAEGRPNCGACCLVVGRPPFAGYATDREGLPCTAYDPATRRCGIYPERPQMCRSFEPGGQECRAARFHARVG